MRSAEPSTQMKERVTSHRRKRILTGCGLALLGLGALAVVVWFARIPLLRAAGQGWRIEEPVNAGEADVIVVLGGGVETRPFRAAELYHAGVAPRIWVIRHEPDPTVELGLSRGSFALTLEVLDELGVPECAIEAIGRDVASTWEEGLALRDRIREDSSSAPIRCIVVPTDPFHTRRADWLLERALREEGVDVRTVAVEPVTYDPDRWWTEEAGFIGFANEVLKTGYYVLRQP